MTPTEPRGLWSAIADLGGQWLALLLDPSERTYWGFLVAAVVLAGVVTALGRSRREGLGASLRRWWGPSARVDYLLVLSRPVIFAVFALPWALSAFGLAVAVVRSLDASLGVVAVDGPSPVVIAAIYSVVLFVAWDLSRYLLHRWMHASALLWELHQVHHSATALNPFTLYRVHPVESALYRLRGVLVTGLVTGVFFYLFRDGAVQLELLGVNAIGVVFSVLGGNLRHSHVWWSWGRTLERWFISPAQHQLHHALYAGSGRVEPSRTNYGTWLAIWDRLGGSLRLAAGAQPPEAMGLRADERNHDPGSVLSALVDPLWSIGRRLVSGVRARLWAPAR